MALVWLYQGLWQKLLFAAPHQVEVVNSALSLTYGSARTALAIIGAVEVSLAVWVLSGTRARLAALVQTALLVGMNGIGLIWGRAHIADPAGMTANNLAFLALVWCVAKWRERNASA